MAWLYMILAALCEVAWIFILKLHGGFTKLVPSLLALFFIFAGPFFVATAMKTIGMGTGYAVWIGVNSVLLLLLGVFYLGESVSVSKLACIALIILGVVGLKLIDAGIIKA
ncbi:MAG: QacE family quaternary ammonium compound efflux SMR transporter [Alphaproteobacteria bacterium]|nr:QacE family quaternary ammonium compound efflux SMR transporter [Alphaproteobacteria bacterium]